VWADLDQVFQGRNIMSLGYIDCILSTPTQRDGTTRKGSFLLLLYIDVRIRLTYRATGFGVIKYVTKMRRFILYSGFHRPPPCTRDRAVLGYLVDIFL